VTLVSATAGAGKTSAIAAWLASGGPAGSVAAWMTLDDTDNDLPRFWADLITALAVAGALPAGSPLSELAPTTGFGAAELRGVWAGLAELPRPVVLVLDDFHQVTDGAVLDSVEKMLDQRATNLHVVISTRTDPALRLPRQRLLEPEPGVLTEIRSDDLAFTDAEAAELFDRSGIKVTAIQLRQLLDRTLGWSAGLRMAALSLEATDVDSGIARFSGARGSVSDYLIGEVVERLPMVDRDFLLRTSVADRLNGDLAGALSERSDGRMILDKLVGANAFVVRFGGRGEWFGYHPLFREMLQHKLSREQPEIVPELHRLAATWFGANDEPIEGIRHAIRGQDWDELTRMLTASFHLVLSSDGPDLVAALDPVAALADTADGADPAAADPPLCALLAAALCHYYRRDYQGTRRDVRRAVELLPAVAADVRPAAAVLIAVERSAYGRSVDVATVAQASSELLALVDRTDGRVLPAAAHYRVVGTNNLAAGQLWAGEFALAEASLTAALAQARTLGITLAGFSAEVYLALLDVLHGRLRRGYRRASDAQRSLDRRGWGSEVQASAGYVSLALTHLARHQLDRAAVQIDRGLAASERGTDAGLPGGPRHRRHPTRDGPRQRRRDRDDCWATRRANRERRRAARSAPPLVRRGRGGDAGGRGVSRCSHRSAGCPGRDDRARGVPGTVGAGASPSRPGRHGADDGSA